MGVTGEGELSMLQMLRPEVLADPYPLYAEMRRREPVRWDAYLHTWVVTSYAESVTALTRCKAGRTPTPEALEAMGLEALGPYAATMLKQMMFLDGAAHTRLRSLCSVAFTPRRVEALKERMQGIADGLLDGVAGRGEMEVVVEFAEPFPGMVTAALLGIPVEEHGRLKVLTASFSELMGNFDHEPDRLHESIASLRELQGYFREAIRGGVGEGLIGTLVSAEVEGSRLSEEEVIANLVLVLVGGFEETTNLIAGGMLTLLRNPGEMGRLRDDPSLVQGAVEELLRYESPTQHTGRVAGEAMELGGMAIEAGAPVMVVLAAANRDPLRFVEPDRLDLGRADNRHVAFGWGAHYCFGSPLARMSGQIAFSTLLRRLPRVRLVAERPVWRENLAMRGLSRLRVNFEATGTIRA